MAIILKANKVKLFVSSVLFVFWYHSPNFLDTPRMLHSERCGRVRLKYPNRVDSHITMVDLELNHGDISTRFANF
jgi:hypothetical protein